MHLSQTHQGPFKSSKTTKRSLFCLGGQVTPLFLSFLSFFYILPSAVCGYNSHPVKHCCATSCFLCFFFHQFFFLASAYDSMKCFFLTAHPSRCGLSNALPHTGTYSTRRGRPRCASTCPRSPPRLVEAKNRLTSPF